MQFLKKLIFSLFLSFGLLSSSFASAVAFVVPTDFEEGDAYAWQSLGDSMFQTKADIIYLYWAGYGGLIGEMQEFVLKMQLVEALGKKVIVQLVGDSYSAHAIAPCYASEIRGNEHFFLMFHLPADDDNHVLKDVIVIRDYNKLLTMCVKKSILTEQDVKDIDADFEVYVYNFGKLHRSILKPDRRNR